VESRCEGKRTDFEATQRLHPGVPGKETGMISVACLMPTLPNRTELRERAIASLYKQVYPADWKVTVYQDIDPKPTLGAKLNAMVAACTEEYITLTDDDDWHSPARVRRQVEPLLLGFELTGTSAIFYQDIGQCAFLRERFVCYNPAMQIEQIVRQLRTERDRLDVALKALTGITGSNGTRPTLSAAARRKISLAQKARWAKRSSKGQAGATRPKRTMSTSARRKIAAAQRARWAKVKAANLVGSRT